MHDLIVAKIIYLCAIAFWLIESWWFGWNLQPINEAERKCDNLVIILFLIGLRNGFT